MKKAVAAKTTKIETFTNDKTGLIFGTLDFTGKINEAAGFRGNELFHQKDGEMIPITFKQSAAILAELQANSQRWLLEDTSDEPARVRWLRMVADAVPLNDSPEELQIICEYSTGSRVDGIAFKDGRIVHYSNGKEKPVTLRESVLAFKRMETWAKDCITDGTHECEARIKWLSMIADCIR